MNRLLVDQFIASYAVAPKEIILDFDATDDAVHGNQQGALLSRILRSLLLPAPLCFRRICAYLHPSKIDGAKHAWAILALLTKRLRQAWPNVKIIFRGDSGFCRWKMLRWCDSHEVDYIVGIGGNKRLKRFGSVLIEQSGAAYEQTGEKQRLTLGMNL